jgi:hypothetical protein
MFERVAELYNQTKDGSSAFRDFESIVNKRKALKNSKELTGDCPPFAVRAKSIFKEKGRRGLLSQRALIARAKKLLERLRKLLGSLNQVTAIFPLQLKMNMHPCLPCFSELFT